MANVIGKKIDDFAQNYQAQLRSEEGKSARKMTKYDVAQFMVKQGMLSKAEFENWVKTDEGKNQLKLTNQQKEALKRGNVFGYANAGQVGYLDSVSEFSLGNVLGFEKTTDGKMKAKPVVKKSFSVEKQNKAAVQDKTTPAKQADQTKNTQEENKTENSRYSLTWGEIGKQGLKSTGNFFKGMFCDEKGFSFKRTATTVGLVAGTAALATVSTPAALVVGAGFGLYMLYEGGKKLIKGTDEYYSAKTHDEAQAAMEKAMDGGVETTMGFAALFGVKKGYSSMKQAKANANVNAETKAAETAPKTSAEGQAPVAKNAAGVKSNTQNTAAMEGKGVAEQTVQGANKQAETKAAETAPKTSAEGQAPVAENAAGVKGNTQNTAAMEGKVVAEQTVQNVNAKVEQNSVAPTPKTNAEPVAQGPKSAVEFKTALEKTETLKDFYTLKEQFYNVRRKKITLSELGELNKLFAERKKAIKASIEKPATQEQITEFKQRLENSDEIYSDEIDLWIEHYKEAPKSVENILKQRPETSAYEFKVLVDSYQMEPEITTKLMCLKNKISKEPRVDRFYQEEIESQYALDANIIPKLIEVEKKYPGTIEKMTEDIFIQNDVFNSPKRLDNTFATYVSDIAELYKDDPSTTSFIIGSKAFSCNLGCKSALCKEYVKHPNEVRDLINNTQHRYGTRGPNEYNSDRELSPNEYANYIQKLIQANNKNPELIENIARYNNEYLDNLESPNIINSVLETENPRTIRLFNKCMENGMSFGMIDRLFTDQGVLQILQE